MIYKRAFPEFAIGVSPVSGSTSWAFGNWIKIVDRTNADIQIYGVSFQFNAIPALDTTSELLIEIGIGRQDEEVTIIQIPYSLRNDTQVGYYINNNITIPEPYFIQVGKRLSVRVANSLTGAQTYSGFKILYANDTVPLVSNAMPNNYQFASGSSGSFGEKIR